MSDNNEMKKYKTRESVRRAIKNYTQRRSEAYIESKKQSNKKYYEKQKEYIAKYKELLNSGVLQKIDSIATGIEVN